jgi:hypothetical protein
MSRRRSRKNIPLILTVIVVATLATASVGGLIYSATRPNIYAGIDTSTFCRQEGARSITVVLMDATDALTAQQSERLVIELKRLREVVPRFDRIVVYAVTDANPKAIEGPLVDACNPGRGAQADEFYETARIVEQKFLDLFDHPFEAAFARLVSAKASDQSPLIEAIESVSVAVFGSIIDESVAKKIIVVSDMLQHTGELSLYRQVPTFPAFAATDTFRMHRPRLTGVEVEIWEINRPSKGPAISRAKIAEFWTQYFKQQGARLGVDFWDSTKI